MNIEVKSFQAIAEGKCDANVKLTEDFEKIKIELQQAHIKLSGEKHIVEQKTLENLNLQKKIITLDGAIHIQKKHVDNLSQECTKHYMLVDDTQCREFRAQVVLAQEDEHRKKYLTSMEDCKMIVQLKAGARAKQLNDQLEKKSKLVEEINELSKELEQKKKQVEERGTQLDALQQRNFMLKKHNEARLLRLQKQVEKAEAHQRFLLKQQDINKKLTQ